MPVIQKKDFYQLKIDLRMGLKIFFTVLKRIEMRFFKIYFNNKFIKI